MKKTVLIITVLLVSASSYAQWTDNGTHLTATKKVVINGNNELELGGGVAKEVNSGKIAYQKFSDGLDIVGAGTENRKVVVHANGGTVFTGPISGHNNVLLTTGYVSITDKNALEFGTGLAKELNAGRIAYQRFTDGLDIVGAGAAVAERKVTIHAQGGLTVIGATHASTYTADTPPWSDFVFEDGYKLRSLESLEHYIKENKHLPEIPSETELKETGLNLPEMDARLLQKIEELTLYVIDLQKQLNALKSREK